MVLDKPLIIWEKLTNPRDRNRLWERLEREELGEKNASPMGYRVPVNVNWEQMSFDLVAMGTPPKQMD